MRTAKEKQIDIAKKLLSFFVALFGVTSIIATAILFTSEEGEFLGYGAKIVMSSSMEKNPNVNLDEYRIKNIEAGSLIVIQYVPVGDEQEWYDTLRIGDVLTFVYKTGGGKITIAHRIKAIEKIEKGYKITLAGDNSGLSTQMSTQIIYTADGNSENRITGKVVFCSYFLGQMISAISNPVFVLSIFLLLFAITVLRNYKKDPDRLLE